MHIVRDQPGVQRAGNLQATDLFFFTLGGGLVKWILPWRVGRRRRKIAGGSCVRTI
jgi:hypothetical protein